ncbi:phospholipase D beta 1-like isoform X2 [Euphorbia lathyris]|uniref:phospholipase D beta 1-like isoform X2 n=1 Tax=Euphorbia lathyris TaxID=212925 RepID=UPI0033132CBD
MENYGSSSPYPYNNVYPYPYHRPPPSPVNNPYPPPPNSDSYNHPSQPYPYAYNNTPYAYPSPSPPRPRSHSGPLDYSHHQQSGYPYPNPSPYPYPYPYPPSPSASSPPIPGSPLVNHQHHGSFSYSSSPLPYPYPQQLGHESGRIYQRHDSCPSLGTGSSPIHDAVNSSSSSAYPPLDGLFSKVHLNDTNRPSAPASPPGAQPSMPESPSSFRISSLEHGRHDFYGYPNDSFSSNCEGAYFGRVDSSSIYAAPPVYGGYSGSFNESTRSRNTQIVPYQPSKGSLRVLLLHGNLDICVYEAKNLPNMDMFHKTLGDMFNKLPGNIGTKIEGQMSRKITSDPYVSIAVAGAVIGRTFVISNSEEPVWMQHFYVPVAHHAAEVHFYVKDSDVVGSQLIGVVAIPVEQIYSGARIEGVYPILNASGKPCKPGAVLKLSIQFTPMDKLSIYHHGVGAGPDYHGVPGTYFPLRKGGTVTLYQDAHVPDGCLPNLMLDHGLPYVHGKCWHDIFDAIRHARRLIYITGWSVWHKVRLIRDNGQLSNVTLGELLRSKSQEGVRVLLLVWDDPTSRSILGYTTDGIMATHDEETRRFFKHSSVQVLLCPRIAGKKHSWVKQREVGTIYTHHQKTVIVDADAGNNRRKMIAFVGGLDLCDGRYDTPHHPLFRTLDTIHKDDYHNPTFTGNVAGSPREPWHDLHSRIDGPAAYDVLTNFEERWLKAAKPHGIKKLKMSYDDALLRIERIPDIIGVFDAPSVSENDPEAWHVQIFRSIDSNSVRGFPKDPREATSKNLVCGKNVLIDMSIHSAYVKAIRAAQHFIYIENQYFIGSSYNWTSYKDLGANNLIPMEIALKIAEKIRANERFAAYIVVPMWPEGVPTGAATQRILFWQHKTMQMMYETIYKALVEVGLENAFCPQDYLNFFCLGNRESVDSCDITNSASAVPANSPQALSRKSRRFMIYVHSKGMVVDDEYVIIGSANINQRSMEGTRDTEIAMGAYQPNHTWARKQSNPYGQIYGYRMSLWAEHTGTVEDCFTRPESLECVKRMKGIGEVNWKQFVGEIATDMRGHLLKYPVEVDRRGKVTPIPGCETFPDVGGNITGSFLAIQENLTI